MQNKENEMTQDEYETEQEYYETEIDLSDDCEPSCPMPEPPPFTEEDYPFDYYNFELDQ
jgi:hypothetical protein